MSVLLRMGSAWYFAVRNSFSLEPLTSSACRPSCLTFDRLTVFCLEVPWSDVNYEPFEAPGSFSIFSRRVVAVSFQSL